MMQLSAAMFGCQFSFAAEAKHVFHAISDSAAAWTSSSFGEYALLVMLFCVGFWATQPSKIKSTVWRELGGIRGKASTTAVSEEQATKCVEYEENAQSSQDMSTLTSLYHHTLGEEEDGKSHVAPSGPDPRRSKFSSENATCLEPDGDSSPQSKRLAPTMSACRPLRPRCPALRAQTAGQPPQLPEGCTSVIIKSIPKRCTPDDLLTVLHEAGYFGEVDFIYVPIDFKRGDRSFGFAILNFRDAPTCMRFSSEFHMADASEKLFGRKAQKTIEVSPARLQGCQANVRRLQSDPVMAHLVQYPAWLPRIVDGGGLAMPLMPRRVSNASRRLFPNNGLA